MYPSRKRMGRTMFSLHDGYLHVDRKYNKAYGERLNIPKDYLIGWKQELEVMHIDDGGKSVIHGWASIWISWEISPNQLDCERKYSFLKRRDLSSFLLEDVNLKTACTTQSTEVFLWFMLADKLGRIDLRYR